MRNYQNLFFRTGKKYYFAATAATIKNIRTYYSTPYKTK
jgi:hypothetical protein